MPNYVTPSTMGYATQFNGPQLPGPQKLSPGQTAYPIAVQQPTAQTALPEPTGAGSGYNINPGTSGYSPIFGGVPGQVGLPNPFQDLSGAYPGLGQTNQALSGDILSQLGGNLSPSTINMIQDQAAAWGINSGMPGSGLARNRGLRDLGLTAENQINQGIGNYDRTISAVSGTQTVNPQLQTQLAERNALMASAPNPAAAGSYAQQLFNQYLQRMRGPGGGTGGLFTPGGGSGTVPGVNVGGGMNGGGTPSFGGTGGGTGTDYMTSSGDFSSGFGDNPSDIYNLFDQSAPPTDTLDPSMLDPSQYQPFDLVNAFSGDYSF
jgi:hypothetical protein